MFRYYKAGVLVGVIDPIISVWEKGKRRAFFADFIFCIECFDIQIPTIEVAKLRTRVKNVVNDL